MTDPVERFLEDNADGYGVQDFATAVEALVTAGLVSVDRAEYWKAEHARFRAVGSGHQGPHDQAVEHRAIELLEALFAAVRPRASDDWDPVAYQRYQEALSTLTGIGALSLERARPWLQLQHETLTPPGGRREPAPDPEMPFTAGELSAVLAGPEERLDGMRVTCMELYGDCVIVRFHQLLPPEPEDPVGQRELLKTPFDLEDDRRTPYEPAQVPTPRGCKPRELKGWPEVLVGWQAFVPGPPLDARSFFATWRDQEFVVSMRTR